MTITKITLRSPEGGPGLGLRRKRRHLGVSRRVVCEDSEDTCSFEDKFPAKTLPGAKTHWSPRAVPERTALAKTRPGVKPFVHVMTGLVRARVIAKTHGRAKTLPEDGSGEDTRRREDMWSRATIHEDRSGEDKLFHANVQLDCLRQLPSFA